MTAQPISNILFLDAETYYDNTYSLRRMTTPEYILDARFEEIIWAVAANDGPSRILPPEEFERWLACFDPDVTATVTFNSLFDNSILAWRHKFVPRLMMDSMNIARCVRGHILPRLNLETCCRVFNLPHDKSVIHKVKGMRRAEIVADYRLYNEFCDYSNRDNERSRDIFRMLICELPDSERRIMDMVIRATVQPQFQVDRNILVGHRDSLRVDKINLLNQTILDPANQLKPDASEFVIKQAGTSLRSDKLFKELLEVNGVTVEYKDNKKGKQIPAFAKTDEFMSRLQEHFNPFVQALACARLGARSTIEENRVDKLIAISSLSGPGFEAGQMPIPLRYAGAHTHRLSGEWKLNMQNLPSGRGGKTNTLRKALVAPHGYKVVAGDLAQIEARLVAWLAGCTALIQEFSVKGGDPYSAFASVVFGFMVNKNTHPIHRFIGKTGILGLGFQCGWWKFFNMVLMLARIQGIDLMKTVNWTEELAQTTVTGYRGKYYQIPNLWYRLQNCVETVWLRGGVMTFGPLTVSYGRVEGPSGLCMHYSNPRMIDGEYYFDYGFKKHKLYGGKFLENMIQFLARIIIMNAALRLESLGYRFALQAHDELAYIVPNGEVDSFKKLLYRELTRRPSWGRDIPLEAEVHAGPSYGDTK